MSYIHSFPPISQLDANVLILGSIPGKASLKANQYYAHPRNLFWPFIAELFDQELPGSYSEKCQWAQAKKIALWDVLKTCTRDSSLDSDIVESSIIANDITSFIRKHTAIKTIYFNGAKSQQSFNRYIKEGFDPLFPQIRQVKLPSTSPANASITRTNKLEAWRQIVDDL